VTFTGEAGLRELRPGDWRIDAGRPLPAHVLAIDDSWVTGAHAQAVSAALKAAGVDQVSVFTVARVLHPNWGANRVFIHERFSEPGFDWQRCPWTGAECP
jgi:hypothetical protein